MLDKKIIIFSTTSALTERINTVLDSIKKTVPIYEATMKEAYEISRKMINSGTEVIICRGGTSEYLRERVDIPVVDIRHGFLDIYRAVQSLEDRSEEVGIIGFKNLCEAGQLYNRITNKKLGIYNINREEDVEEALIKAVSEGKKYFVGGFLLEKECEKRGLTYIPGEADELSILSAVKEAEHNLKIEEERKTNYEIISVILENISEGIIAFDRLGNIYKINKHMKKILGEEKEKKISEIFQIKKHLKKRKHSFNNIVNYKKTTLLYNVVPIEINQSLNYILISVQEINAIKIAEQKIREEYIKRGYYAKHSFSDLWGESDSLAEIINRAKKYSNTDSTILIRGETGTGKEIFAQSIHNYGYRKKGPFVAINCAALPQNILESELFGYVKGAFTGAVDEGKKGIFEIADGGTVFLDEISELPIEVQGKLLRVIQEKEICRLGDNKIRKIDVRIIVALNQDLVKLVEEKKFREDLYYRICVLELIIPPLRKRDNDVLIIFEKGINNLKNRKIHILDEVKDYLRGYSWPGNVREVLNIVERLGIEMGDLKEEVTLCDIKKALTYKENISRDLNQKKHYREINPEIVDEKERILFLLEKNEGDRTKTASDMNISNTTLWRKMKKHNI
ncbi:sigma-54-dependent Fis family transcriptional regulator [Anaerosphaera multitolerans]|uniref:sigma-54-dependent Fis family transcriptional regulator n=1 Tax=Anaerosphaera multitolerans TaxID=2487351 RepID=UPI000FDB22A9|nr:sigma-54-dependent Fis family transcriptional regulator [Anaerosphaera multitolerans]